MADEIAWKNRIIGYGTKPASQFTAHPRNWRRHPARQRSAVRGSLDSLGWVDVVIENKVTGHVVDGHERIWNALKNGDAEVPYIEVELSEAEEAQALLSLDAIAALAETDRDNVQALLAQVQTDNADVMQFLSDFAADNKLDWNQPAPGDAEPAVDRAAELLEKWQVKSGDLWRIGDHRLLCGDSTKREDVERVMGGEKAVLFVTDPPYGVNYSELRTSQAEMRRTTVEYEDIEADRFTGVELQAFLESVFNVCKDSLEVNAAWYLWHAQLTQGFFAAAAAAAADILIHRQIIWVKPSFIFGRGDYHWKHELCFYGWRKGNRPPFYGERNQDTVWSIDAGGGSSGGKHKDHPTQKPIALYEIPLRNHTKDGQMLLDPFAGSGTALIACQNLGRKCRAVEISPAYVAVCLQRMADAFPGIEIARIDA